MNNRLKYHPYKSLNDPNIIVDGSGNASTVLTLSHWPNSGTPEKLLADLSTQIVFNYIDHPEFHVDVEFVSNNHFDEDGLVGIYALLNPDDARSKKSLLIDVASAGDFEVYKDRHAARIVFTLRTFMNTRPNAIDPAIFKLDSSDRLYLELLSKLPDIIDDIDSYNDYWSLADQQLDHVEALIQDNILSFEEYPDIDLSVVIIPEHLSGYSIDHFRELPYLLAIHNTINCYRVLLVQGQKYRLYYRYESWINYISKKIVPRIDLSPLAKKLTTEDKNTVKWKFNNWDELSISHTIESALKKDYLINILRDFFNSEHEKWNPWE